MTYTEAVQIGPALVAKYCKPGPPSIIDFAKAKARLAFRKHYRKNVRPQPTPTENEIPLKQWIANEASQQGLKANSIYMRISRGDYPNLTIRRVNGRVAFVTVP